MADIVITVQWPIRSDVAFSYLGYLDRKWAACIEANQLYYYDSIIIKKRCIEWLLKTVAKDGIKFNLISLKTGIDFSLTLSEHQYTIMELKYSEYETL